MGKVSKVITEYGDDWFSITGPQLMSSKQVKMKCRYRGDGGPSRFYFRGIQVDAHVSNIKQHNEIGLTTIGNESIQIRQVEHILSALIGLDVLDTTITLEYVNNKEDLNTISPPVCNLSSREYCLAILSTFHGRPKNGPVKPAILKNTHIVKEESPSGPNPSVAVFAPLHKLNVTSHIDYSEFIGTQIISTDINPNEYLRGICWARSFFATSFPHEIEWEQIRSSFPAVLREEENHFRSNMLDYTKDDWITPPIVNTEPVRHKLLDFLGDIALVGRPFKAAVYIYKPHHKFNRQCAMELEPLLGN